MTMYNNLDDFIAHIGVKRKSGRYRFGSGDRPYQHEGLRKPSRSENKEQRKRVKAREKQIKRDLKYRKALSTRELEDRVKRLELEKKLKDLTNEELQPGKAYAKETMKKVGQSVATTAAQKLVSGMIENALKKNSRK